MDFPKTVDLLHRSINEKTRTKYSMSRVDVKSDLKMKRSIAIPNNSLNLTVKKSKNQKPSTTTSTKPPPRRVSVTKPTASGNITVWPKHSKRLGNDARKALGSRAPNQTDESTGIDFKTTRPIDKWKDNGFYTDDYVKLINQHWFKFAPPNPSSHYILGFLYVVIMLVGCLGNFLVIFMYIKLVCRVQNII